MQKYIHALYFEGHYATVYRVVCDNLSSTIGLMLYMNEAVRR
jgi:hypothetical protein